MVRFERLPDKYKSYENLQALSTDSDFNVRIFSSIYPKHAFKINDSLICIAAYSGDHRENKILTSSFYKVDNRGYIADSLIITNDVIDIHDNYMIEKEKEYYLSWLIDEDTTQQRFVLIEDGKLVDEAVFEKHTKDVDYSDYLYVTDTVTNQRFVKTFYYKDNNWNKIYSEERFLIDSKYPVSKALEFKSIDEVATLEFYQRQEWNGHHFPDFGLYINGKPSEHWKGTGYYKIKANNKEILFKRWGLRQYLDNDDLSSYYDLRFYENPSKNYLLILDDGGYQHFLVQYK